MAIHKKTFHSELLQLGISERRFKVKEDLVVVQARLAIPPSTCGNLAMSSGDVSETSKIANVRIYVEQTIGLQKYQC
jgi:hypothetical protein